MQILRETLERERPEDHVTVRVAVETTIFIHPDGHGHVRRRLQREPMLAGPGCPVEACREQRPADALIAVRRIDRQEPNHRVPVAPVPRGRLWFQVERRGADDRAAPIGRDEQFTLLDAGCRDRQSTCVFRPLRRVEVALELFIGPGGHCTCGHVVEAAGSCSHLDGVATARTGRIPAHLHLGPPELLVRAPATRLGGRITPVGLSYDRSMVATGAPLRVAHLLVGGDVDGIGLHVVDLAEAQLRQGGVRPVVVTCASPPYARRLDRSGVPVCALQSRQLLPAVFGAVRHGLVPADCDLIHLHGFRASQLLLVAGTVRPRLIARRPLVATCHGLFRDTRRRRVRRRVELRSYARVGLLVATSPDQVTAVRAAAHPPPAVEYVPNGVRTTAATQVAETSRVRAHYGMPPDCDVVAAVGRLAPEKRHDLFLQACAWIAAVRPSAHFVIAGEGPQRDALQRLAHRLGIGDRVHFLGLVDDVAELLSIVTVLLHTSDNEATPRAILEAMAAGVPVVATAVGGVPDLVEDGVTGVLRPRGRPTALADAVVRLLGDVVTRELMGTMGRQRVQARFSMALMAERIEGLYRRHLIGEGPSSP